MEGCTCACTSKQRGRGSTLKFLTSTGEEHKHHSSDTTVVVTGGFIALCSSQSPCYSLVAKLWCWAPAFKMVEPLMIQHLGVFCSQCWPPECQMDAKVPEPLHELAGVTRLSSGRCAL
eukprot:1142564-Pelagomonas_calceolata.AAC.8